MPTAHVNGVQLAYDVTGESGPPLLMVHGSWVDRRSWAFVVPDLSRSFRVVTFDRRGHSESPGAPNGSTIHDDVGDMAAVMRHLGLERAHIVGNSYGASISLRFASAHPELVLSLIAHEPPLAELLRLDRADSEEHAAFLALMERVRAQLALGHNREGAQTFVEGFFPGLWESLPEPVREIFSANGPTFLDELNDPDSYVMLREELRRIQARTLLTTGSATHPFFPRVVRHVAAAIPHATSHSFEGAGHLPHQTHAPEFADKVAAFALG